MASYSQLLITGGSGFLGWNLAKLAAKEYDVYYTYRQHPVKIKGCQEYHLDLQKQEAIEDAINEIQPEVIIHTAALAEADVCEERRSVAHDINVTGTRYLAEYAEEIGARFIYISTDLVFDGKKGNYLETDAAKPINYYGESKLLGERVVQEVASNYLIVRLALMYGNSNGLNLSFTDWMHDNLKNHRDLPLFTDQFRSPLFVEDGARALLELIDSPAKNQVLHLGGKERVNRYDFGQKFTKIFGYEAKYLHGVKMAEVESSASRGGDCSLNIKKVRALLSFELSDIETSLKKMKRGK